MIIFSLFDEYDFSGKNIIPFNTHEGSGDGGTYETIKELEPNAKLLPGFPIGMEEAEAGAPDRISRWLKENNF